MKKTDVELVLMKSFDYWKSILCNEIDLGELHNLTNYIWDSIQFDQELDTETKRIYIVTKKSLNRLIIRGEQTFKDIYGNTIVLKFMDTGEPPCLLESGTILVWDNAGSQGQRKITEYSNDTKNTTTSDLSGLEQEIEKLYRKTTKSINDKK